MISRNKPSSLVMDIYTLSKILSHSITEQAYLDLTEEDIRQRYQDYSPLENIT